ncbi:Squalene monooxygenase [Neolecta irregularis DAH-3]|uniref:Squalene monooxygenase n=1 Tax=Neolecta irregularis (strain DAH-3) TaxID=1198029 RepID=A0A1U7LPJ8_NEOID|nr:Squalene monooxygenase [Neolecta irregularis DAH-3]|eukprot:OLL24513.1 Squalene monooxygenase [Neolecta irregularis DAH-3]
MRPLESREHEVIIVGAGVLGSAMAYSLGNQGRKVLLIERDFTEPDRIVGELLQPGGVNALKNLGMGDCLDHIDAVWNTGYTILFQGEKAFLPYLFEDGKPMQGCSFHHGKFIAALREKAMSNDNISIKEASVTELISSVVRKKEIVGVKCLAKNQQSHEHYFAPLTIIADGCFSKFRNCLLSKKPQVKSNFVGLVLKDIVLPSPHQGHVVVGDNAPILLYQIGTHDTRILIDVPGKLPSQADGSLKRYVEKAADALPEYLRPALIQALSTQRIRSMPNSFLPPSSNSTPGVIILGDAMNMRHPLTGGGMTVALNDVVLFTKLMRNVIFENTNEVMDIMQIFHWRRKHFCTVINLLAQNLYSLFAADDCTMRVLQQGCFYYLQSGGVWAEHPIGLLSGIYKNPPLLFVHFFLVALYSIFRLIRSKGLSGLFLGPFVLWEACCVIFPILATEFQT